MKLLSGIKQLFTEPKTTAAGLTSLVGAAAMGYGMYTGHIPITPQALLEASGLATTGAGLILAKDGSKKQAAAIEPAVTEAAPDIIDAYLELKQKAIEGQAQVDRFYKVTQHILQAMPQQEKQ